MCQFAHHEKQRFAVPNESERFGASENAIPAKIVVVHTGQLHDGGNDAPVLVATAFVGAGRQMVLDRSVALISQVPMSRASTSRRQIPTALGGSLDTSLRAALR